MAPLLKSGGRKPLEVRLLYPPQFFKIKVCYKFVMIYNKSMDKGKRKIPKILFYFFILISAIFIYQLAKAQQQASGNALYGWAWSSNIGWVSLNCEDLNVCGQSDYRVSIAPSTGKLGGYAWSSNIGWINFAPIGSYPENPQKAATIDFNSGNISGWIRACSVFQSNCKGALKDDVERGGWDGWIKMSGVNNVSDNIVKGFAWGGDVLGWLYFDATKGISTIAPPPIPLPGGSGQQKWIEIIPE